MSPNFICIGAPKAGTTWLYSQLQKHPDIWIPPLKELHYFDKCFPIAKFADKRGVKKGFLGFYPAYNRKIIIRVFGRAIKRRSLRDFIWASRYFGGESSDEWYLSLFENIEAKVCGELTTDYCALSADAVEHISKLLPDLRIIILLRNPVERAWSHARMLLPELLGKALDDITEEEFISYMCHPAAKQKGEYVRALDIWEAHYSKNKVFIGYYDDIVAEPETLLRQILEFLGVDVNAPVYAGLHRRVNVGKGTSTIPPNILDALQREYRPELQALSQRLGGHAEIWSDSLAEIQAK